MRKRLRRPVAVGCLIVLAVTGWWWYSISFPSRPPDNDGVIESVSTRPSGGYVLRIRVAPVPRDGWPVPEDEQEERERQWVGIVIVHVPPSAVVRGQHSAGPRVGQRARAWCMSLVMTSFPPQHVAEYVMYEPADG